jgi:hypothetical protein
MACMESVQSDWFIVVFVQHDILVLIFWKGKGYCPLFYDIPIILPLLGVRPGVQPRAVLHRLTQGVGDIDAVGVEQQVSRSVADAGIGLEKRHIPEFIVQIWRVFIKVNNSPSKKGAIWSARVACKPYIIMLLST